MESHGNEGILDALLFLVILSFAASIAFSSLDVRDFYQEIDRRDVAISYARDTLDSILATTLDGAYYYDEDGGTISLDNSTTVGRYIVEETYLLSQGWRAASFSGCNEKISEMTRHLIHGIYGYSIESRTGSSSPRQYYLIAGEGKRTDGYSVTSEFIINGNRVTIMLTIWWT